MNAPFITLDGSDGAGKSTQMTFIREYLSRRGVDFWCTREPGGTPYGEALRQLLLDPQFKPHPESELLTLMAARAQHLQCEIWPRLARGQWVISDRFNDATYAYQGQGRGIPWARIAELERWMMGDFAPSLRILLLADPQACATRRAHAGTPLDRFEREREDFKNRVAQGFAQRAQTAGAVVINAQQPPAVISAQIAQLLDALP